jgi:hypothetical protein
MAEGQYPDRAPYLAEGTYRFVIKDIRQHAKMTDRGAKVFAIVDGAVKSATPGSRSEVGDAVVMFNTSSKGGKDDLGGLVSALDPEHMGAATQLDLDKLVAAKHPGTEIRIRADQILVGPRKDRPFTKYSFKAA